MTWLLWIGAFVVGLAAEFASEVWGIGYTNAVGGRYARVPLPQMESRIRKARTWGLLLFGLSQVDTGSVLGGPVMFACVTAGAACGAYWGIGHAMRAKWRRLNGGKPDEDEEEE